MALAAVIAKLDELIGYIDNYDDSAMVFVNPELRIPHATPLDAFKNAQREKVLFVTSTRTNNETCSHSKEKFEPNENDDGLHESTNKLDIKDVDTADFIAVVNVDPLSPDYCKIIKELPLGNNIELHHFGWNSCAGCLCNINTNNKIQKRRFLIAPAFSSGDVFIIDTNDIENIKLHKKISGKYLHKEYGVAWPHTSHCLANGNVMMSFLWFDKIDHGDHKYHNNQFLLFNGNDDSFNCIGKWINKSYTKNGKNGTFKDANDEDDDKDDKYHTLHHKKRYSYDFWYQPYHNIMISSEWGHPHAFSNAFDPKDIEKDLYGHCIHFWDWTTHRLIKTVKFKPDDVIMSLETRFLHDPKSSHAFINGALTTNIVHIYKDNNTNDWICDSNYIKVNKVNMLNWLLPEMPGLITDILISMDDKYLYFANWLHGDIRQYDISDPFKPKLTGQVFTGGLLRKDNGFNYKVDMEKQLKLDKDFKIPNVPKVNSIGNGDVFIEGGPQMLQLSLDGKRLYVTNSLFSPFDKQFYPNLIDKGGMILMCDIDHENGGIKLNTKFCADFGRNTKSGVPARPHEMRYPGGDCTSDIFIDMDGKDVCCCSG